MYSLQQAISWSGKAAFVSAILMLCSVLVLYVRAKWYNSHYYESRMAMLKTLKVCEINAILLLFTAGVWIILNGVHVGS